VVVAMFIPGCVIYGIYKLGSLSYTKLALRWV
jgi:hypothetical protein